MSLLNKLSINDLCSKPYPHIIKQQVLSKKICDALVNEYPSLDDLNINKNTESARFLYGSQKVAHNDAISQTWKDAIAYFSSPESFKDITSLFADELVSLYPKTFPNKEFIKSLRIGIRGVHNFSDKDVLLDAQIRGNTGDSKKSTVQTSHIDSHYKVYSGLLYLRPDEDDTTGGNFEIRKLKDQYVDLKTSTKQSFFNEHSHIDPSYTEIDKIVEYQKNTLMLFINSLHSIHSVSQRAPTQYTRKFLAFTAEMRKPLFITQPTFKARYIIWKKSISDFFILNKIRLIKTLGKLPMIKKIYSLIKR